MVMIMVMVMVLGSRYRTRFRFGRRIGQRRSTPSAKLVAGRVFMATYPASGRRSFGKAFVRTSGGYLLCLDARSQSLNGLQRRADGLGAGLGAAHLLLIHKLVEKLFYFGITLHTLAPGTCFFRIRLLFLIHFGPF
jgi:hypothetical protein